MNWMPIGRRLPARLLLALVLSGLALLLVAMPVQAAANRLSITAHVGYTDTVKPGQWMPVKIAITNNGPDVNGSLVVQSNFGGNPGGTSPATYVQPLVIAAGATKFFRTYLVEESVGLTVTVRVVSNGRILASVNAANTNTATTLVGVLSDDSTALDDLSAVHPSGGAASVVHLGLADVADSGPALRAFDLLAIDDFATDGLTASQRVAIADFVQTGGSLLVGTGASWRRTLAGLPAGILPIQVSGLTTLAPSAALGSLSGVQVATGTLTGVAWLSDGGQPLLASRTIGSGSVTIAAFDWKQDPIPTWIGTRPLLRQVLVRSTVGSQSAQSPAQNFAGPVSGPFGGQGGSIYQRSSALSQVLGSLPALNLPSLALTGVLVLVYVLLVGPINYFVLGALHRRALAWITLPLIAVLVAGGAYGGGILTKGQSVQTNQLSILHLESGSDRAFLETYTGVVTPTRGDYQVGVGRQPVLVSPIVSNNQYGGSGGDDIRVNVADGSVTLPGMTAFTLRGLATEGMTTGPRLSGHLREVNGQLMGTVENLSSTTFTDAVVVAGDGYQKLGALAPGASMAVAFAPKIATFNGPPAIYSIYPNYSFGPQPGQPTEAQRDGEAKTRILTLLQSGGSFKGLPSSDVTPMLVAWTSQPFQDLTVNGGHPRGHSQTAVALDLPVENIGLGPLPAGIVSGRIVDLEGDPQQGPPGALSIQDGAVTYEFTPRLVAGAHLTGASLSASNPYSAKGAGANGSASTIRGEAWDWSRSTWVDVAYQDNATTSLPDEVINPGTGEVRLRITVTNGGFLALGISLAGNVR